MVFTIAAVLTGMPSIGQWVVGIVTTVVGLFVKQALDDTTTDDVERLKEAIASGYYSDRSADPHVRLEKDHFVDNGEAVRKLTSILSSKLHCLLVVGAPPGSGKSVSLGKAMDLVLRERPQRRIYYFAGLVDIYEQWQLPKTVTLASIFPTDAVLVFDQVDDRALTSSQQDWMVSLATQARNSTRFHVVVLVSYPDTMRTILRLNGGEKIMAALSTTAFAWSNEHVEQCIQRVFLPPLTETCRQQLVTCIAESSGSPGLVKFAADRWTRGRRLTSNLANKLKKRGEDYRRAWDAFLEVSETNVCIDDDDCDDGDDNEELASDGEGNRDGEGDGGPYHRQRSFPSIITSNAFLEHL